MWNKKAFTLIELLIVIAIIGLLVAILLPAIRASRSAARSTVCKNNLRQLSIATIHHESALRYYPPARIKPHPDDHYTQRCGEHGVSWIVHILPFMEEQSFFQKWDVHQTFASHPASVRNRSLDVLVCPERRSSSDAVHNPDQVLTDLLGMTPPT